MWVVDAEEGKEWRQVHYEGLPPHLSVAVRFGPTTDGVAATGVRIERRDGRAIQARDLRFVHLPPWYVTAGEAAARWYQPSGPAITPSRRGPKDEGDEKHRMVWELYCAARRAAPTAPIRWMLPQLHRSDATVRRWVRKARDRAGELGWDAEPVSQEGTHFPRYDEQRPAGTADADGADS